MISKKDKKQSLAYVSSFMSQTHSGPQDKTILYSSREKFKCLVTMRQHFESDHCLFTVIQDLEAD